MQASASPTIEPQPSPATTASLQSPIVGEVHCPQGRCAVARNVATPPNVSTVSAARLIAGPWVDTSFFHDSTVRIRGQRRKWRAAFRGRPSFFSLMSNSLIPLLSNFPAQAIRRCLHQLSRVLRMGCPSRVRSPS